MTDEKKAVKTTGGIPLFYEQNIGGKTYVTKPDGTPLGSCSDGQTRDISGKVIAQGESPAMLYENSKKKK